MGKAPAGPGPGGVRGRFDPAQMREMMAQRFKAALACSDEEWKVIGPRVEKVVEIRFQPRFAGGGFGGQGGRGGMFQGSPEAQALNEAIQSKDTPDKEIKAKLKTFRDAAKKREAELKKARDEALAEKDREKLKTTRRQIHRLRRKLRRAMKITA